MLKADKQKLYCFSPLVMLVTFVIEILLAIWVALKYRLNPVGRVAVLILVLLSVFQLSEYQVCQDNSSRLFWAQAGYAAITALPALGLHLSYMITRRKADAWVGLAYLASAGFVATFLAAATIWPTCEGNYVFFTIGPRFDRIYGIYYLGLLFFTIWHLLRSDKKQHLQKLMLAGYVAFVLPTAISVTLAPSAVRGIPSIMCGFALIFALILAGGIMPRAGKERQ